MDNQRSIGDKYIDEIIYDINGVPTLCMAELEVVSVVPRNYENDITVIVETSKFVRYLD